MDLKLRGRKVLVTGASKGIGYAAARCLAQEGCDVILVSRTARDLEAARERIRAEANVAVTVEPADLSDGKAAMALAKKFPDIDVLVNNAGAIPGGSVEEIDETRWRTAWDLKVFGYINLTREYFRLMKGRGRGVIINVIGGAGERMNSAYIAGSAGKRVADGLHARPRRHQPRRRRPRRRHQSRPDRHRPPRHAHAQGG